MRKDKDEYIRLFITLYIDEKVNKVFSLEQLPDRLHQHVRQRGHGSGLSRLLQNRIIR